MFLLNAGTYLKHSEQGSENLCVGLAGNVFERPKGPEML